MSNRANLNALSFLDLPTELRLSIYEIHFKHPSPLLLLADGSGNLHLYRHIDDQNHGLKIQPSKRDIIVPHGLIRAHQPTLQLLRVSRQIHREAASTFYSNDFQILRGVHAYLGFHDTTGTYMNQISARWLRGIAQHQSFVRKLCIDIGSVCILGSFCVEQTRGPTFRREDGYLHFGELVQAVSTSETKMVITFTDQDIMADATTLSEDNPALTRSACDPKRLSVVVQALCKDTLGMKKSRRAIGDIGIKADGSAGVFVFWTLNWQESAMTAQMTGPGEPNPLLDHTQYFSTSETGTLSFVDRKPRKLLDLPRSVLARVVEHTLDSRRPCEIDLDSFADFEDLFGILYVDMGIHDRHIGSFLREYTFELSMMSTIVRDGIDFGKLGRLLRTTFEYISTTVGKKCRAQFGKDTDYTISLQVHSGSLSLDGIRITAIPLLVATFAANGTRVIKVHAQKANDEVESSAFQIRRLRRDILRVLERYVKKDHAVDAWIRCPEVCINGHGEIVDVVGTGSLQGDGLADPAKTDRIIWSAFETGYVGAKAPEVPDADGLARSMYLYLKWISV